VRLLVCGSRDWTERLPVLYEIKTLAPDVLIHGDATGADRIAAGLARELGGVESIAFPADWARDGRAAGPIRNGRMLRDGKPDRGLAFGALWRLATREDRSFGVVAAWWKHTGTGDMVWRLLRARVPVRWIESPGAIAVDLVAMPIPVEARS
jgi:hypothetical protein